jgi:hypothetical protein
MRDDPERLVIMGHYADPIEAELAANFVRRAGIRAMVVGDSTMPGFGMASSPGHVVLTVPSADAPRASAVLAEVEAASLGVDWEDEAEATAVCTLCGGPLTEADGDCPACRTPRDAIRPPDRGEFQR